MQGALEAALPNVDIDGQGERPTRSDDELEDMKLLKDVTGHLDYSFYISAGLLLAAVIVNRLLRRPFKPEERRQEG